MFNSIVVATDGSDHSDMHIVPRLGLCPLAWMLICLAFLAACGPPQTVTVLEGPTGKSAFQFLRDGETRKTEILGRLGEPENRYEGERIYTYPVELDNNRRWHVGNGRYSHNGEFRLVLVFGSDNVLRRHSLVATSIPVWPDKSPK
jgi:hypothetical protein